MSSSKEFNALLTKPSGIRYISESSTVVKISLDNKSLVHVKLCDNDITPCFDNIKVISTPGHTPNHISLYMEDEKLLIAGNLLDIELNLLQKIDEGLNFDNFM